MTSLLPEEQRFFDEAVERLQKNRRTFTERTALEVAWAAGYELLVQYDKRFVKAQSRHQQIDPHYRLSEQKLANRRLFNDLMDGSWDGYDLDGKLAALDEEGGGHHVFYPYDTDLQERRGRWEPAREKNERLTADQQSELDACLPDLLQNWARENDEPWTLQHIQAILLQTGRVEVSRLTINIVRSWLLGRTEIRRVGQDLWLPAEKLPAPLKRARLQVLPIRSMRSEDMQALDEVFTPTARSASGNGYKPFASQNADAVVVNGEVAALSAHWVTTLRTINLAEGFLAVPVDARSAYPPAAPGENPHILLDAVWHADGEHFWLWLDRQQHRLYGPGLLQKIEWDHEAGDVLRISWAPDVLTIFIGVHDEQVHQEETRLVDPEALKKLRGGLGEAYRDSIQRILSMSAEGLTFQELMQALCERLGHKVHHGTVRALLVRGGFVRRDQRWFAAPDSAAARRSLRTTLIATLLPQSDKLEEDPPSLGEQIHQQTQAIIRRLEEIDQLL